MAEINMSFHNSDTSGNLNKINNIILLLNEYKHKYGLNSVVDMFIKKTIKPNTIIENEDLSSTIPLFIKNIGATKLFEIIHKMVEEEKQIKNNLKKQPDKENLKDANKFKKNNNVYYNKININNNVEMADNNNNDKSCFLVQKRKRNGKNTEIKLRSLNKFKIKFFSDSISRKMKYISFHYSIINENL